MAKALINTLELDDEMYDYFLDNHCIMFWSSDIVCIQINPG